LGTAVASTQSLSVDAAQFRTLEDAQQSVGTPVGRAAQAPFRPTMDPVSYHQLKASLAAAPGGDEKVAMSAPRAAMDASGLVLEADGIGNAESGGFYPPDAEGAVGDSQFVEAVTSRIVAFEKGDLATRDLDLGLENFFGYFNQSLFDPRVSYDAIWNRWVIAAQAFPESPTVQLQFLAISYDSDLSHGWFVYAFNVLSDANYVWDYPQLGMDQDSIIITANYFSPSAFVDARTFAVAKGRLYNGLGWSVQVFTGLCGTLAPPNVLDENGKAYLVCAPASGSTVTKYTMTDSSRPNDTRLFAATIPVEAYSFPPSAPQRNTPALIETGDARFQNTSTQIGDFVWQVHTVKLSRWAAPLFYQFNAATNTVVQSKHFFADASSFDWNPSIVVDPSSSRAFVTWTSNEQLFGIETQVRFDGCQPVSPCVLGAGVASFTSGTSYSLGRWGAYSAVSVDPFNPTEAYLVNEGVLDNTTWSTRLAHISLP
jgi:hypothetical protein